MIIFGWGYQTIKNIGPAFKRLCSHCNNEQYWNLNRIITWFTLFFIPLIPYKVQNHLSCPVCQYGLSLTLDQISKIKPLAELNKQLMEGTITGDEYAMKINLLNNEESNESIENAPKEIDTAVVPSDAPLAFCTNCGKEQTKEIKFCGSCGTANASNH